MKKEVKIMRGIPGSGKSTFAKQFADEAYFELKERPLICSADDFFIGSEGYKFDTNNLGEAHKWCMRNFLQALQDGMSPVIVDNTNINLEDFSPYVAVGQALGYDVEIVQVNTDPNIAAGRNIHGVPDKNVFALAERMKQVKIPNRFKVTHINPK